MNIGKINIRDWAKWLGLAVYLLILLALFWYLFFASSGTPMDGHVGKSSVDRGKTSDAQFAVGYAYWASDLDPVLFDFVTRSYLVDVYEGLVKTDKNLKIVPGIAISWGMIDDYDWKFVLRPGIKFHNGKAVNSGDVVYSINRAMTEEKSGLKNFLSTIASVRALDEKTIEIKTKSPDPLLLNKLSVTFIYPDKYEDFNKPIGTGPYKFYALSNENLVLNRFDDYWGLKPYFREISLEAFEDKNERLKALENGTVQFLVAVPPFSAVSSDSKYYSYSDAQPIKSDNIAFSKIPSLEVVFLIFNNKNDLFKNREVREAVKSSLNYDAFVDLAFGFAKKTGQFISNGIFGYNPSIKFVDSDINNINKAKEKMKIFSASDVFDKQSITFDYPVSMESTAQVIKQSLMDIGIDVKLNSIGVSDFEKKIMEGKSDLYILGWRSELGDAGDFLDNIVHTRDDKLNLGVYNGGNYSNKKVDELLDKSRVNFDERKRLVDLQEAVRIVTEEDIIGVPLFESDSIFAYDKSINFDPRIDGYLHIAELTKND